MRFLRAASCSIGANPLRGKSTRSGRCASNCAVKKDTLTRSCKTKSYEEAHAIAEDEFLELRGLGMAFR